MGRPETLTNFGQLDSVHFKMRRQELSQMGILGLRDRAKELSIPTKGNESQLIDAILTKESSSVSEVSENEMTNHPEAEPPANDSAEKILATHDKAVLRVIHPDQQAEAVKVEEVRNEIVSRIDKTEEQDQKFYEKAPEVARTNVKSAHHSVTYAPGRRIAYTRVDQYPFGRPKRGAGNIEAYEAKASFEMDPLKEVGEPVKSYVPTPPKAEAKPVSAPETKTSTIEQEKKVEFDGLVEFKLGKMGLLDVSDPKMIETRKKELAEKIQKDIPNFFKLEKEQQLYTLNKLSERQARVVDFETRQSIMQADKENGRGGFIGKWLRGMSQEKRISKTRQKNLRDTRALGFDGAKEDLKKLTDITEARELKVRFGEKANLVLQFMERKGENTRHQKLIDRFNEQATALSNIPHNFTIEHAAVWQKKTYELAQRSFEKARTKLMEYESKDKKLSHEENATKNLELTNIDAEIQMSQFLSDNPDLEGKVNQFIKDNPVLSKLSLMGLGAGARGLVKYGAAFGGGLMTLSAGGLASGAIGGFTSWVQKRGEFRDLEAQKRAGADIGKREGVKEFVDLASYTKRLNKLIEQAKKATDDTRKQRIVQTIQTRLTILQDRTQTLGAVKFGGRSEDLKNQFEYTRAVKEANALILSSNGTDEEIAKTVYKVFDEKYLQDDAKDAERQKEIRSAFKRGAVIGATAFVGGYIVGDLVFHKGEGIKGIWGEIEAGSKKVFGMAKEYAQNPYAHFGSPVEKNMPPTELVRSIKPISETIASSAPLEAQAPVSELPSFKAEADNRGVIGMLDTLQKQIRENYLGKEMPGEFKYITSKSPEDLAKLLGAYRAGEGGNLESLIVQKGANLSLENGNLVFHDGLGHDQVLTNDHGFEGTYSSAEHSVETGPSEPHYTHPEYADQNTPDLSHEHTATASGEYTHPEYDTSTSQSSSFENSSGGATTPEQASSAVGATPGATESLGSVPAEGLVLNTPEIHGTLKVTYDDFGRVMKMDLGTTGSVTEVNKFLGTPDKFLVEDLKNSGIKFGTRSFGTSELSAIKPDCADYLKYRAFLRAGNFQPGSPEYTYLTGQMNLKAEAIHRQVGNIFRPLEEDRLAGSALLKNEPVVPKVSEPIPSRDLEAEKAVEPIKTKDLVGNEQKEIAKPPVNPNIVRMEGGTLTSETPSGRMVHFESKDLKGELVFKKVGTEIVGLGGPGVRTVADGSWQKFLEDDYGNFAKKLALEKEISEDVARKRVYLAAQSFVKYKGILEDGGLGRSYPEGKKFLERQLSSLLKTYGDVLKDEKYSEIITSIKKTS